MLDVHPPHAAAHTWKDFFIHIATIVVGLLIAVGLEQTVEFFHHRHLVAETREALRAEREQNHKNYAANAASFRYLEELLKNDMLVLRALEQHPGTPEEKLPGVLFYTGLYEPTATGAWQTAKQTTVTQWMSTREVSDLTELYRLLAEGDGFILEYWHAVNDANVYRSHDPDLSHLTPAQIQDQIRITERCIASLYRWGVSLGDTHLDAPDFNPSPTSDDLNSLNGYTRSPQDEERIAPAYQITRDRIAAAQAAAHALTNLAEKK